MRHSTIDHAPDHVRARCHGGAEQRAFGIAAVEYRAAEGDATTDLFTGCASVFDVGYEMYGGPPYGWIEYVDRGACDKTLAERCDTQLLINHGDMPLARTKSGTLRLAADVNLDVEADLEPTDPDVIRLRPKLARRDMDEMSFAFLVIRQEWNDDYTERHIREVSLHKGDVSIVNYGANDSTWANDLRSVMTTLAELDERALERALRAGGGDWLATLTLARDVIDQTLRGLKPTPPAPVLQPGADLDEIRSLLI